MERKPSSTNSDNQVSLAQTCVLNDTLSRVSLRWKMQILFELAQKPATFGEIKSALPRVTDQVLAKRIRELLDEGLIVRDDPTGYRASAHGTALLDIMYQLCAWARTSAHPEVSAGARDKRM